MSNNFLVSALNSFLSVSMIIGSSSTSLLAYSVCVERHLKPRNNLKF